MEVSDTSRTRIVAFPYRGIAYNDSFYDAIERQGALVIEGDWSGSWILRCVRRQDIIHIHWPSFLYESNRGTVDIFRYFLRFIVLLTVIRIKSKKIFWTAHNLLPHERCKVEWIDCIGRYVIIAMASKVFVHGKHAQDVLTCRFPKAKSKCVQIPHGHWKGKYGPLLSRQDARERLGLPDAGFVYLLFGQCKPYKNIEATVSVFRRIASDGDLLLIAGRFSDDSYLSRVKNAIDGDSRVIVNPQFIPDDQVSSYLCAADAMCIPYKEILTSGTAMLAMSYGRPVLSIERGFLRDVINEDTGVLISANDDEGLAQGIRTIRAASWDVNLILDQADQYTFDAAAQRFLDEVDRK